MTASPEIESLKQIDRLLDEALKLADLASESLVGAYIAEAQSCIEDRIARLSQH